MERSHRAVRAALVSTQLALAEQGRCDRFPALEPKNDNLGVDASPPTADHATALAAAAVAGIGKPVLLQHNRTAEESERLSKLEDAKAKAKAADWATLDLPLPGGELARLHVDPAVTPPLRPSHTASARPVAGPLQGQRRTVTALLASIGAAGIPSAGLVVIFIVTDAVNLRGPEVDLLIGMLLAIDRPLDMYRTMVNVFSDSSGAAIIARSEGETQVNAA